MAQENQLRKMRRRTYLLPPKRVCVSHGLLNLNMNILKVLWLVLWMKPWEEDEGKDGYHWFSARDLISMPTPSYSGVYCI